MKKYLIACSIGCLALLEGCAGFKAPKQVVAQDGKDALQISCPGIYAGWNQCYEIANKGCPSGFNIIEREQYTIDLDLPIRTLTFRCK